MAGQNHHHLSRTVLEESAPRVPVHPPPLDNSDVMGVPGRDVDDLLFQDQQRTSPLSTSFADLMLGDHTALRHKGRDGRLGRCGEGGRDSTRLYGLSEAATIANLRETVLALQLQNTKLSLCLQQERSRREQAESLVDREKGYIKRLEDTIQTLKNTRLVIDPNMYRQIAESYIASRKAPVRRTCSSSQQHPGHYEDLVCDSSPDNSLSPSPTSPNSKSSSQFLSNNAMGPGGGLSPTYTTSSSTSSACANDTTLATLLPLPSTSTSRLQSSQPPIFNERQDLRWPSERGETSCSIDDFLFRDNRSDSNTRRDIATKRRDV